MIVNNYASIGLGRINTQRQCFGANQSENISGTNDKQQKKSALGFIALAAGLVSIMALGIRDGIKEHKTFKNYCKNMSFTDWNCAALLTSGVTFLACGAPEFLGKDKDKKDNTNNLRSAIGTTALGVMCTSMTIGVLGIFINLDSFFKKRR